MPSAPPPVRRAPRTRVAEPRYSPREAESALSKLVAAHATQAVTAPITPPRAAADPYAEVCKENKALKDKIDVLEFQVDMAAVHARAQAAIVGMLLDGYDRILEVAVESERKRARVV